MIGQAGPENARVLTELASVVVIGGTVGERFEAAHAVVSEGCHVFLAWPPGVSTDEATRLAARAEEAGVEVGAARPLAASGVLQAAPEGWTARLVTLTLSASPTGRFAETPWSHRIAGALDVCATLADSRDAARVDAQADRENGLLHAIALSIRFRTGAYAQAVLRVDDADAFRLDASGPGARLSARSLDGPLCIERGDASRQPVAEPDPRPPDVREAVSFIEAIAAGRRAPFALADALATMRLAEAVGEKLRG
ncbi:MAG: hypothetical protein Rubg2KO_12790 [Rubricoccaceae bacterium]